MKIRTMLLAIALATAGNAVAHEGHDHGDRRSMTEDAVKARAGEEVTRLVAIKKLEGSWKGAAAKTVERKGTEWLVTFENARAKDPDKKVLYVFLKASGDFVAANFTGR